LTTLGFGSAISKYDLNGNFIFAKAFQSDSNSQTSFTKVIKDKDNNLIAYGDFNGTVDFDPSNNTNFKTGLHPFKNFFVAKLDTNGNLLWVKTINAAHIQGVSIDTGNNIITYGWFADTVDFDPSGSTFYYLYAPYLVDNGFILTLNSNGNFLDAKQLHSNMLSSILGMSINKNNTIFISGACKGNVDFDLGVDTNYNQNDTARYFVAKYTNNFDTILFQKTFCPLHILFIGIGTCIIDSSDNIFLSGNFNIPTDFNPDPMDTCWKIPSSATMAHNAYLLKLDSNGNFQWVNTFDAPSYTQIRQIKLNQQNLIVVLADVGSGFIDYDPSAAVFSNTFNGNGNTFLANYNTTNGAFNYVLPFDTLSYFFKIGVQDFVTTPNNEIICAGTFADSCNFSLRSCPNTADGYIGNMFLAKYTECVSSNSTIILVVCDSVLIDGYSYTNDTTLSNTYPSIQCCDSNVQYAITIKHLDTYVTLTNNSLNANQNNASYQWFNCMSKTIISGATGQSFSPTQSGQYAVIVNNGSCVDTSACYSFIAAGLHAAANASDIQLYNAGNNNYSLHIAKASAHNATLKISNTNGAIVYTKEIQHAITNLPLDELARGLYILQYGSFVVKLVVQ
jgi:hypothetical protein